MAHSSEYRPRSLRFRLTTAIIVGFLGIVAIVGSFFLFTEPGLRIIADRAIALVPGDLTIKEIKGRLSGPVHLRGVRYADGDLEVHAASMRLDVRLIFLLAARIQITRINVSDLTVQLPPPANGEQQEETAPPVIRSPLAIRLEEGVLESLAIHSGEGQPSVIERILLSGSINRKGLILNNCDITAGSFELNTSGSIIPEQKEPIQARAAWSFQYGERPSFAGEMDVTGDWKNLTATHSLSSPFSSQLLVRLRSPLDQPVGDFRLAFENVSPEDLAPGLPGGKLSGSATGTGWIDSFTLTASLRGQLAEAGNLQAFFSLAREGPVWKLDEGKLKGDPPGMELNVSGYLDWSDPMAPLSLSARWGNLTWPPGAEVPLLRSKRGDLSVQGRLGQYRAKFEAYLEGEGIQSGTWTVSGRGDGTMFTMDSFRFFLLDGEIEGRGSVRWKNHLAWQVTAEGRELNPGVLMKSLPGRVSLTLDVSGEHEGKGGNSFHLEAADIGGTFRENDLGGSMKLLTDGRTHKLEGLELSLGSAKLSAAGVVGTQWNIQGQFRMPDAGTFITGAGGSADGIFNISGPRVLPRLRARLSGDQLSHGQTRVRVLEVALDAGWDREALSSFKVSLTDPSYGPRRAHTLTIQGSGTWGRHRIDLDAVSDESSASAVLEGSAKQGQWTGNLRSSLLEGAVRGNGSLTWGDLPGWNVSLDVDGIDPGVVLPAIAGDLSFTFQGRSETSAEGSAWMAHLDGLKGQLRGLPVNGSADVEIRGDGTVIRALDLRFGRARLEASGEIKQSWNVEASISVPAMEELIPEVAGAVTLSGRVTGDRSKPLVRLDGAGSGLSFHPVEVEDLSLAATFGMDLLDPLVVDLNATGALAGETVLGGLNLSVRGTRASHEVTLKVDSPVSSAEVLISGRYGEGGWTGNVDGGTLDGTFEASGTLKWFEPVRWETRFRATDLNPGKFSSRFPERISLSGWSSGEITAEGTTGRMYLESLEGSHRGQIITGSMDLEKVPEGLKVKELDLGLGNSNLSVTGQVLSRWDLDWVLDVPDMSSVWTSLGGAVAGSGHVEGPRSAPGVRGTMGARDFSYGSLKVEEITVDADVKADPVSSSRIEISLSGLTAGSYRVEEASLLAAGPVSSHGLSLIIRSPYANTNILLSGGIREGTWTGEITRWEITSENSGNWSLAGTAPLRMGDLFQAGPACLEGEDARVCMEGSGEQDGRVRVALRWVDLGIDVARLALPKGFRLEGTSEGILELRFSEGSVGVSGRFRTSPGLVAYGSAEEGGDEDLTLLFRRIGADLNLDEAGLKLRIEADLGGEGEKEDQFILGTIEIPGFVLPSERAPADLEVSGRLQARFSDLGLLEVLVPELARVTGIINTDLTLSGPLSMPELRGETSLTEGSMSLVSLGVTLQRINLTARIGPENRLLMKGSLSSGEGDVKLDGDILLRPSDGWPVKLSVSGEDFEVVRIPLIRIIASPDLVLEARSGELRLKGMIRVPEASLELADISTAGTVSSDVEVSGRKVDTTQESPLRIHTDVTIELGERVSFKGLGLSGGVAGRVQITERPGVPTSATGELRVLDGQYQVLGRRFSIRTGRLIFTGGQIDNPGLDIQAVREVGEVTAGVEVRGTLLSPLFTLFSDPALQESDILSYLILGRPLSQASSEEAQTLSRATTALALTGGLGIAREITSTFGLEDVRIESSENVEESTLVLGKYISPRVYVQYGVGLFQDVNVWRFEYQLSRKLMLQGETSSESGADLIYSIER